MIFVALVAETLDAVKHSVTGRKACTGLPDLMILVMMAPFYGGYLVGDTPVPMAPERPGTTQLAEKCAISSGWKSQGLIVGGKAMDIMTVSVVFIGNPIKTSTGQGVGVRLRTGIFVLRRRGGKDVRNRIRAIVLAGMATNTA